MTAAWDRRSADELARTEEIALADWLPGATTFAPYWAERVRKLGLNADELVSRAAVMAFPPVIQGDVAAGGGAALVQRPTEGQVKAVAPASLLMRIARGIGQDQRDGKRQTLLQEFKPVHITRGGAADQLAIASSRADIDRMHRVGARAASLLGLGDHDYMVSAVPAGPSADFWSVHALAMGSSMLALHPRGHGDGLERCIDAFALQPTTVVACLPQDAVPWAHELAAADADVSRVVVVLLVGPPPDDDTRAEIESAWRNAGARERELVVRAAWAPDVHRGIWSECKAGTTGLHTMPDLELLEVLDALTGTPTDGAGDLAVTSLGWSGTTLVRYRTGAAVGGLTAAGEACPACQRTVPRVTGPIVDRAWQPELRTADGVVHLDLRALAIELTAAVPGDWRVLLQRKDGVDSYALEVSQRVGESTARTLAAALARASGITPGGVRLNPDDAAIAGAIALNGSPFVDQRERAGR